jgi:hypothetical protein
MADRNDNIGTSGRDDSIVNPDRGSDESGMSGSSTERDRSGIGSDRSTGRDVGTSRDRGDSDVTGDDLSESGQSGRSGSSTQGDESQSGSSRSTGNEGNSSNR